MKTDWKIETLSRYPEEFEPLNTDTYIQRRNIQKINEEDSETEEYTCEYRKISKDVYNQFMEALEAPSQQQLLEKMEALEKRQKEILEKLASLNSQTI